MPEENNSKKVDNEILDQGNNNSSYNCGIVMPIADHPDYSKGHWKEILSIIKEVVSNISEYDFECELVSESNGIVDPIHKHIVNNLFDADIIVCDISSKNPNVFFELGMRLAFDKPVVIIKDDKTESPFDTGVIRFFEYDSNLRYRNINLFKTELSNAIIRTFEEKQKNPNFSPFLSYFKEINYKPQEHMASEDIEVPSYVHMILNKLDSLERNQQNIKNKSIKLDTSSSLNAMDEAMIYIEVQKLISEGIIRREDILKGTLNKDQIYMLIENLHKNDPLFHLENDEKTFIDTVRNVLESIALNKDH